MAKHQDSSGDIWGPLKHDSHSVEAARRRAVQTNRTKSIPEQVSWLETLDQIRGGLILTGKRNEYAESVRLLCYNRLLLYLVLRGLHRWWNSGIDVTGQLERKPE